MSNISSMLALGMCIWVVFLFVMHSANILHATAEPKIDIMMRTWERDTPLILMFLRSFEIFFPMNRLGNLFLVLDQTKTNKITGSIMPEYVKVVYEVPLNINVNFPNPHDDDGRNDGGRLMSQISNFFSDDYGESEVIGIVDSDVIFRAPAMDTLMFKDGKPKLFCSHHRDNLGMDAVRHIASEFASLYPFSCMESFPFLMWRSSFPRMRKWLSQKLKTDDVKQGLIKLVHSNQHVNFFGNFAMMGAYLFHYERDKYHIVVGGNGLHSTCPELRGALHVHYSIPNFRQYAHKLSWEYFRVASKTIYHSLKLCSNKTSLSRKIKHVHTFLSLEANQEYMFGYPGRLSKAGCDEYLNSEIKYYLNSVSEWCTGI
jgi:hypothetical protein